MKVYYSHYNVLIKSKQNCYQESRNQCIPIPNGKLLFTRCNLSKCYLFSYFQLEISFIFQKQYIFLYRALLDVAQFGNTEIHLKDLNTTVEQLKQRSNDSQCKLEIEFDVSGHQDELDIKMVFVL